MKATAPKKTLKREERAAQIWQVLIARAANEQTITYKALAEAIGMGPGTLSGPLDCILRYCDQEWLPCLTVLVVQSRSGQPAGDDWGDVGPVRQKVFGTLWFRFISPTADDFAAAYTAYGNAS